MLNLRHCFRMKVAVLDITSRNADQYNPALCNALGNEGADVTLLAPVLRGKRLKFSFFALLKLIPAKWESNTSSAKRALRLIEVVINYVVVFFYIVLKRPEVLHIQWLPLIDYSNFESGYLKLIKIFSPKLRVYLTAHNVYPHNIKEEDKSVYKKRFLKVDKQLDGYLVHLESSRTMMHEAFGISEDRMHIAYHGIYTAEGFNVPISNTSDRTNIILYGIQNKYKGADLFVDSLALLPQQVQQKINAVIVGRTDAKLYSEYKDKAEKLGVKWVNRFVADAELYEAIGNADLILLPYRNISQSGVLLLALSYRKPILTSDLSSFKETLHGYPDDYFFKREDPQSLADMLTRFVNGDIDKKMLCGIIDTLNNKYSWRETAKATLRAYCL